MHNMAEIILALGGCFGLAYTIAFVLKDAFYQVNANRLQEEEEQ